MQIESPRLGASAGRQAGISLVELLVAMVILSIVTTMILGTWFALQNSFAYTSRASHARELARDSVTRMTREVRDAQGYGAASPITYAGRFVIVFSSTFNQANNSSRSTPATPPVQTAFVYVDSASGKSGTIYRVLDKNNVNGVVDELGGNPAEPNPVAVATNGRVVVDNVVNGSTSLFRYTYWTDEGDFETVDTMAASTARILSVHIRVLVDLNPSRAPVYMDLQTTAQPRNGRPSS